MSSSQTAGGSDSSKGYGGLKAGATKVNADARGKRGETKQDRAKETDVRLSNITAAKCEYISFHKMYERKVNEKGRRTGHPSMRMKVVSLIFGGEFLNFGGRKDQKRLRVVLPPWIPLCSLTWAYSRIQKESHVFFSILQRWLMPCALVWDQEVWTK